MLIAVSSSLNTVFLAFRGTIGLSQFWQELTKGYDRTPFPPTNVNVNKYFYNSAIDMWENGVYSTVNNASYQNYNFVLTGHSLGGALSSLTAYKMLYNTTIPPSQVTLQFKNCQSLVQIRLVTFGEPRTGDYNYANELRQRLNYAFRVVHGSDPIPHLPWCASNSAGGCKENSDYYQHAQEIW